VVGLYTYIHRRECACIYIYVNDYSCTVIRKKIISKYSSEEKKRNEKHQN
jgi:hypothetical protein